MGGMASIWRAIDTSSGETVAVKRLHPHLVDDPAARERLVREAAAMQALHHPNVVSVRDLVADAENPAIVMDFVPGLTVADRLAADGPLAEPTSLAIAASVADALAAAHARGIVHRDVKPANVLIGEDGRVRLADFGIATDDDETAAGLTAADDVVGTLRYLAPERLAGARATPASDIWSLSAVLVELVTGTAIMAASTLLDRVASAPDPLLRPDGVSDRVWGIAALALAPDPAARFAGSADLAVALHSAAGTEPDPNAAGDVDPWSETTVIPVGTAAGVAAESPIAGERRGAVTAHRPRGASLGLMRSLAGVALLVIAVGLAGWAVTRGFADASMSPGATRSPTPSSTPSSVPTRSPSAKPAPTRAPTAAPTKASPTKTKEPPGKKGKGKGKGG